MKKIIALVGLACLLQGTDADAQFAGALAPLKEPIGQAVTRGVDWMYRTQLADGTFPNDGWGDNLGVVGLVGLAYLSAGITPSHAQYGRGVNRIVDFMVSHQQADGTLWSEKAATGGNAPMYAHAIGCIFLSSVSGMVDPPRQKKIDAVLPRAVVVLLKAQNHAGGWRYTTVPDTADLSVSGLCLTAMRVARLNGAQIPKEKLDLAMRYVMACRTASGGFGYQQLGGVSTAVTGIGLLFMEFAGYHGQPATEQAARLLLGWIADDGTLTLGGSGNPAHRYHYAMFYATMALYQHGGGVWEQYATLLYPRLLAQQHGDGHWGGAYATAMILLCLTTPYQQLPAYQR